MNGLPILVFKALPVMFQDELGRPGLRRVRNALRESEQAELPIGMSRRVVSGVERVWLNCAVCHTGTYRLDVGDKPTVLLGAPANNLRLFDLLKFFVQVGNDPGFNADKLIETINGPEVGGNLNVSIAWSIAISCLPACRPPSKTGRQVSFIKRQSDWGPGRVDTFNPYKALQFNFPMGAAHISDTELNGSSDFPAIWQQRPREGMHLHWDGNNTSVDERNLSAALGAGVTPVTVDIDAIHRIRNWMWTLPTPGFPSHRRPTSQTSSSEGAASSPSTAPAATA